ncbi:MAG TPA: hypothetical protein VN083_04735 [Vicinamibacteria bacterium]|nr:hypothetical protein [Vicinamibacteria bacterium]
MSSVGGSFPSSRKPEPGTVLHPASLCLLLLLPSTVCAQVTVRPHPDVGIAVAKVSFFDGAVDVGSPDGKWTAAREGSRVRTGDLVRTNAQATARVEFPFMSLVVGPSSVIGVAPSQVLATLLESGRLEEHAEASDAIKLRTPEAQLRGRGHVVVRRDGSKTSIMVWDGRFLVQASGHYLTLIGGVGTVVERGKPLVASSLPPPPADPRPGPDPLYVAQGEPLSLAWQGTSKRYHVQVFGIDSDEVLLERETGEPPLSLLVPWLEGTFRWHVSERDERGLESRPSHDGLFCFVGK